MKLKSSTENGRLRLCLEGELDHHAAKRAVAEIEQRIDSELPRDCILDMSGLSFMDSSGIAVILKTYRRMNEIGGRTSVANVRGQPQRVIDASGVERIINVTVNI